MSFCMNCGMELPDGAKYCSNCGTATEDVRAEKSYRKTIYEGELHKCPNCGELLNSFVARCPSCRYELRSVNIHSSVSELAKKIENATSVEEKNELIINFYVPNTREDIFDFFIWAVSYLEGTTYDMDDAWQVKLEQTYHKAKILFGDTSEIEYIENLYNKTRAKLSRRVFSNVIRKNKMSCVISLLVGIGIIMIIMGIILIISIPHPENPENPENLGGLGGAMLCLFGMGFLIYSTTVFEEQKEKMISKKKSVRKK